MREAVLPGVAVMATGASSYDAREVEDELPTPYGVRRLRSRGNSVVSRTLCAPSGRATQRSSPSAKPPCGGIPYLNACR